MIIVRRISAAVLFLGLTYGTPMESRCTAQEISREISLDLNQTAGPSNTMWRVCVGAGRVGEGLKPEWQRQLILAHQELGFEHLRCHGLYHDELGVYRVSAQGQPIYDFAKIDQVYDLLVKTGVHPFVEFSFTPEALASSNEFTFWWKANCSPPNDLRRWADLITATTRHWIERYGLAEVQQWWFEVWNEPNLQAFLRVKVKEQAQLEYFHIYDSTVRAVKAVGPTLRVGGPAGAGPVWNKALMEHCSANHVPLDFISYHAYSTHNGPALDEYGRKQIFFNADLQNIAHAVQTGRQGIEAGPFSGLPLHLTEWNTSPSARDPSHDAYQSAPFILEQLKNAGQDAQSMSYWDFTDIFEESGPVTKPFQGCFGLMTIDGIRKPTWFAYAFLNRLGPIALKGGDSRTWATTDSNGGVQVLLWDYRDPVPGLAEGKQPSNQKYFIQEHPAKDLPPIRLTVSSLKPGRYQLEIRRVGWRHNDAYTVWLTDLKRSDRLTPEQLATLQSAADGHPEGSESITITTSGKFNASIPMREFDVVLVVLKKV